MLEFVAGVLLAVGAVTYVLRPIFRPDLTERELPGNPKGLPHGRGEGGRGGEGEDPDDDLSPRAVALRALKEIDFDRATGKLSDEDYGTLHARYTAEALDALRGSPRKASPTGPRSPLPAPRCGVHG